MSPEIASFDEAVRCLLSSIVNIKLDEEAWVQASLPVRWGGVGVRRASSLAPSAFLASVHSSASLVGLLMPNEAHHISESLVEDALAIWVDLAGIAPPS